MNVKLTRKKVAVIAAILALLLGLTAFAAYRIGAGRAGEVSASPPPPSPPTSGEAATRGIVSSADKGGKTPRQPVEAGYYLTRMNVDWTFPSASEPSTDAYVENAEENVRTVYFDLTVKETGELVYSSPYIPAGAKLGGFKLDKELPKGEYAGIVTYHLVDDDLNELTTVSVGVKLRISK